MSREAVGEPVSGFTALFIREKVAGGQPLRFRDLWRLHSGGLPTGPLVYFIGGERGPIKIGYTATLNRRLTALRIGSPVPLAVHATAPGPKALEREYHRRFKDARSHGEWFSRTPELEAEIARLQGEAA